MTEIQSIYDIQAHDINFVPIRSNREKIPLHKEVYLREDPCVKSIPWGRYAGEYAVIIRTCFSPIENYPHDDWISASDIGAKKFSVEQIANIIRKKQVKSVFFKGGDPLFKYHDENIHIIEKLREMGYFIGVYTTGLYNIPFDETYRINYLCVMPPLIQMVPKEDEPDYQRYLARQCKKLLARNKFGRPYVSEWIFIMDLTKSGSYDVKKFIMKYIFFIHEIFGYDVKQPPEENPFVGHTFRFMVIGDYRPFMKRFNVLKTVDAQYQSVRHTLGNFIYNLSGARIICDRAMIHDTFSKIKGRKSLSK